MTNPTPNQRPSEALRKAQEAGQPLYWTNGVLTTERPSQPLQTPFPGVETR